MRVAEEGVVAFGRRERRQVHGELSSVLLAFRPAGIEPGGQERVALHQVISVMLGQWQQHSAAQVGEAAGDAVDQEQQPLDRRRRRARLGGSLQQCGRDAGGAALVPLEEHLVRPKLDMGKAVAERWMEELGGVVGPADGSAAQLVEGAIG